MSLNDLSLYPLKLGAGTVSAPSLYLSTDTGTGRYRPSANQIGEAISGTQRMLLSSNGLDITGTRVQVTNSGAGAQFNVITYRDSAALSAGSFFSARGTLAAPANLQTGDIVCNISARPWLSGTTFGTCGAIRWLATENHSGTAEGSQCVIYVNANGGTTLAAGLTIGQDRALTIPGALTHTGSTLGFLNTAPTTKQTISGAKAGNTALASVIALLVAYGLGTDSTT
jgi:hypothetical protein